MKNSSRAFTLVEMLAVMAIIAILVALIAPAFNNLGRSMNITTASQLLIDDLNAARQLALSQNRQVEVRFYDVTSEEGDAKAFRAFRFFLLDENGLTPKAVGRVDSLPKNVILSRDTQFSTLEGTPSLMASTVKETLPRGGAVDYRYFRFRPDGSTDLDATKKWFWTIRSLNDQANQTTLPPNFSTIQLDAVTGRPRLFRP